jgi:uncharacterized protein (DUF2147 family)
MGSYEMKRVLKALTVLMVAAAMVAPAAAEEKSIAGDWRTGPGDLAYRLELCGTGEQLCGIMTYTRDQDPRLVSNVGKQIIDHARRVGPQSWKGDLIFAGHKMSGTMTLEGDELKFDGCAYLVVCGKFSLFRM